jgi:hypothetical protein
MYLEISIPRHEYVHNSLYKVRLWQNEKYTYFIGTKLHFIYYKVLL